MDEKRIGVMPAIAVWGAKSRRPSVRANADWSWGVANEKLAQDGISKKVFPNDENRVRI